MTARRCHEPAADGDSAGPAGPGKAAGDHGALMVGAFEAAGIGLILLDAGGEVLHANTAALGVLGYRIDALVGQHISAFLPGHSHDSYVAFLDRHGPAGTANVPGRGVDVEAVRSDGSTFPVHVGVAPFIHDDQTFYLCTCQDTTEREEYRGLIAHLARHDRATGCLNRFGIEEHLDQLTAAAPDGPVGVVYLDLGCLAEASESYPSGVAAGLVAQAVARLHGTMDERDKLARVGRHEFVAVVVPDGPDLDVSAAAARLSDCLQAPLEVAAWRVPVGASVGVSLYPEHARTPERLLDRAEAAMRRAKRSATGGACLDSREDQRRDAIRDEHLERVSAAVERGEFTVFYQPQFDLTTLQTTGLEALLRWHHPDEGLIAPAEFLPLLQESGLMPAVTGWILREAVACNARLVADGILEVPVAVNVGPEIFEDRGFVGLVSGVLEEGGLAAGRLEIEITEATATTDPAQVAANAQALRALGVGIAVDDFGTGFSSLQRLRLANFSKLKIDRTYVGLLPGDGRDRSVVGGLLDLAAGLDMEAVAEGIETEDQLRSLRVLGCRYGQGYWYGRPMPEEALRAWIRRA